MINQSITGEEDKQQTLTHCILSLEEIAQTIQKVL